MVGSNTTGAPFLVAIGASAGGLDALERFFRALRPEPGMSFVVVIPHPSPDVRWSVPALVERSTSLRVQTVVGRTPIEADTVYLMRPGTELALTEDALDARELPAASPTFRAFFGALARTRGERCAAIALSGAGTDGLADVRAAGGLVLVQDEESPTSGGALRVATPAGPADRVLSPEEMPAVVAEHVRELGLAPLRTTRDALRRLFTHIHGSHGIDFAGYRASTLNRRLTQRANASTPAGQPLEAYVEAALHDPREIAAIVDDLLIGVTAFFRDPSAFDVVRTKVAPLLLERVPPTEEVRVWVPACSTGEEAYTIAMILLDTFERAGREPKIRVFASDASRRGLETAGEGLYPEAAVAALPAGFRARFFSDERNDMVRVSSALRKCVVFSSHNVLTDAPFSRVDLISCRNLLIYLEPAMQQRALASFNFALGRGGLLFLGPSESLGEVSADFEPLDADVRIFRKVTERRPQFRVPPVQVPARASGAPPAGVEPRVVRAYEALLSQLVPAGVLVDEQRTALHVFGDAARFLSHPPGRVTNDLAQMVPPELRAAVLTGILIAARERQPTRSSDLHVAGDRGDGRIDVSVHPVPSQVPGPALFLVRFDEHRSEDLAPSPDVATPVTVDAPTRVRVDALEAELALARASLQATVQQLETANDELQTTNEELQSSNEELQATNEELHSVNQELYTVNEEHTAKILQLDRVASDLRHLMRETEVGMIFTDRAGAVQLFTPVATELFNLLPQDVGRPLDHITSKVPNDDVVDAVRRAMLGERSERRVNHPDGRVFLRRVLGYRDADRDLAGVLVSFVDVSPLDRAERELRRLNDDLEARLRDRARDLAEREERLRTVTDLGIDGYVVIDTNEHGEESFAFHGLQRVLQLAPGETPTRETFLERMHPDHLTQTPAWREARRRGEPLAIEFRMRAASGWVTLAARALGFPDASGRVRRTIITYNDITALRRVDAELAALNASLERRIEERTRELAEREQAFRTMIESLPDGVLVVGSDGCVRTSNRRAEEIFGLPPGSMDGRSVDELLPVDHRAGHQARVLDFVAGGDARRMASGRVVRGARADGHPIALEVGLSPIVLGGERLGLARVTDVSDRVRAENELRRSEARFRKSFRSSALGKALLDAEGVVLEVNPTLAAMLGQTEDTLRGRPFASLVHAEERAASVGLASPLSVVRVERRLERGDGSSFTSRISLVPLRETDDATEDETAHTMALVEDVSELRAAQEQQRAVERKLQEAAKLESLGVLAGGIAHDFNNLVSGILGNAQHARALVRDGGEVAATLDDVVHACRRAAEICAQMLAYSGRSAFVLSSVDVGALIDDTHRLLRLSARKSIRLDLDEIAPNLPPVRADRAQLQQVLMNLIINASEAIGERPGTIRVRVRVAPAEHVEESVRDVPWVAVEVADDGDGIAPENLGRIFEPFFTTKMTGRGLGLAAVQGIVHAHGGTLTVESKLGVGTTFRLLLPSGGDAPVLEAKTAEAPPSSVPREKGTVLVVDDEHMMRRLGERLLQSRGYTVVTAEDGRVALDLFRAAPKRFDLILLDLTMPVLDGAATLRHMRALDPHVKVILMSGYTRAEASRHLDAEDLVGFLPKPIEREQLLVAVERALAPR